MRKSIPEEKRIEWEDKFRKQRESGLSIDRWCRENQVSHPAFYYWKERLYPKPLLARPNFVELPPSQGTGISIECRGVTIRLDRKFDRSVLKQCLDLLAQC
jgi:hypothetical protein